MPPAARAWPISTTLSNLIESTGSTQGIKLRMSPPKTPNPSTARNSARLDSGGASGRMAPWATLERYSADRSPSTSVSVTSEPARVSGAPGTAETGIEIWARRSLSDKSVFGGPKRSVCGPSTKISGAENASRARAVIARAGCFIVPPDSTFSIASPAFAPSPGTRSTYFWIKAANSEGLAAPAGISSDRCAIAGTQIVLQVR